MANGEIVAKVEELLAGDGKISTSNAMRLSLTLQKQMYQKLDEISKRQDAQEQRLNEHEEMMKTFAPKAEVDEVKDSSIVLWIRKHEKLALAILAATYVVDPRDLLLQALRAVGVLH